MAVKAVKAELKSSKSSKSRIELQNLQMSKKMLEKSTQFLSSEQPCGPKSLNVFLNIAGAVVSYTFLAVVP